MHINYIPAFAFKNPVFKDLRGSRYFKLQTVPIPAAWDKIIRRLLCFSCLGFLDKFTI